jgi:hypothetical protein
MPPSSSQDESSPSAPSLPELLDWACCRRSSSSSNGESIVGGATIAPSAKPAPAAARIAPTLPPNDVRLTVSVLSLHAVRPYPCSRP